MTASRHAAKDRVFLAAGVSQPASNTRTEVDEPRQRKLDLARRAEPNTVAIELIRRQKTGAQAFCLAITSSGLDDSEICDGLALDHGYFSRIKKGQATLQADLIGPFCDMVGNTIYPEWQAYQVGCTLVVIKSEAERRAEAAEQRAAKAEERARILEDLFRGAR